MDGGPYPLCDLWPQEERGAEIRFHVNRVQYGLAKEGHNVYLNSVMEEEVIRSDCKFKAPWRRCVCLARTTFLSDLFYVIPRLTLEAASGRVSKQSLHSIFLIGWPIEKSAEILLGERRIRQFVGAPPVDEKEILNRKILLASVKADVALLNAYAHKVFEPVTLNKGRDFFLNDEETDVNDDPQVWKGNVNLCRPERDALSADSLKNCWCGDADCLHKP